MAEWREEEAKIEEQHWEKRGKEAFFLLHFFSSPPAEV